MKRLIFLIIFVQCISNSYAWEGSIKLFIQDNSGRIDSVIFGISENSTLGIDSILGEINIFNSPFDSLDMRVIQRDSNNHICGGYNYSSSSPQNLYFPENIDSKIDFRPLGGFNSENNNFEIYINALDFPITLRAKYTGITGHATDLMANFYFLDNECNSFKELFAFPTNDTLATIDNNLFTTLVVSFEHEVGIKNYEKTEPKWKIFPNPSSAFFTISSDDILNGTFEILNIKGKKINTILIKNNNKLDINLNDNPNGIYLINYIDSDNGKKMTKRIIKN